jgi:hypothetical protein
MEALEDAVQALVDGRMRCNRLYERTGLRPLGGECGEIATGGRGHGERCGAAGRSIGIERRAHRAGEHIRQDLQPERAARAAARNPDLLDAHAQALGDLDQAAQRERDAFEDCAGEVAVVVPGGEAEPAAARVGIGMRRALAREVGQEDQAIGARPDLADAAADRGVGLVAGSPADGAQIASRNQRSEPPAESTPAISCQVPGIAWQKVCIAPLGSTSTRSIWA